MICRMSLYLNIQYIFLKIKCSIKHSNENGFRMIKGMIRHDSPCTGYKNNNFIYLSVGKEKAFKWCQKVNLIMLAFLQLDQLCSVSALPFEQIVFLRQGKKASLIWGEWAALSSSKKSLCAWGVPGQVKIQHYAITPLETWEIKVGLRVV